MNDPLGYGSRVEKRRDIARRRRANRRKALVVVLMSVLLAAGLAIGGWLVYRKVTGGSEPEPVTVYNVTVPEGFTNRQTAERVEEATDGSITFEDFMGAVSGDDYAFNFLEGSNENLEGYLFPKTYEVTEEANGREMVGKMLDQFTIETSGLDWSRSETMGLNPYEVLIVASMVEKEAKLPEERPVIASVIYNRLRNNMKLQICATVQYALGEWKSELSYEDLEIESPYNTYVVDGLPPGPICNPGFESIRAALYPAETDYLYFILTSPEGKHSFTADYDQFMKWKQEQQ